MTIEPVIRLRLFGHPRVEVAGEVSLFPQRDGVLRLLVRLILQAGVPHPRKGLAFSLWPDTDEEGALANLRRHLYLLRQMLPEPLRSVLYIGRQTVMLDLPPHVWIDVIVFEQTPSELTEVERAVTLYTGELAEGVENDDVILPYREKLRSRYLDMILTLAQTYLERQDYPAVLTWTRQLLSHDPWNEEAARMLMTAEAMLGNRSVALHVYKTLEKHLSTDIGVQPMPETIALYRAILHHHIPHRLSPHAVERSLPFIGREQELSVISEALHQAESGHGSILFIHGSAGIGKTTLVREAVWRLLRANLNRVFWGNCQPTDGHRPYKIWQQIFNRAIPLLVRQDDEAAEWLHHLLPLLPDLKLLRAELIPPGTPDPSAFRLALRQALYALTAHRSLVFIIEDGHWIDDASLAFLDELAESIPSLPLLLIITHRSDSAPAALLDLKRKFRRARIARDLLLQLFTPQEVQSYLTLVLKLDHISAEALVDISAYARGLPLLLREAVQMIQQQQTHSPPNKLPSLRELFSGKIERLSALAREMLEIAAILGDSLADTELRAVLQWQSDVYAYTLDVLQSEQFLVDITSVATDDYTFSHQLIHDIVLSSISPTRRRSFHERIARALAQLHADETGFAGEIALHYEQAGLYLDAASCWLKHAQECTDLAAFDAGLNAIQRAEALLTVTDRKSQEIRSQATLQRGIIALHQGQSNIAQIRFEEAIALARPFPSLFANTLSMYAYVLYHRDQNEHAHHAAGQAFDVSMTLHDIPNAVRALNIRALSALMLGRIQMAIDDLHHAMNLIEQHRLTPSAQMVQSLNHLGTALVFARQYSQAQVVFQQVRELARGRGLRRIESAALTMLGQMALNRGQYEQALQGYHQAITIADNAYVPGLWGKFAGRGWAYVRMGHLAAARADFMRGLEIATHVDSQYGQLLMRCYLAFTDLAASEEPAVSLAELERAATALHLHPVIFFIANAQGQFWRMLHDDQRAVAAHTRALTAAQACNVPMFVQWTRLQILLVPSVQATVGLTDIDSLYQEVLDAGEIPLQSLARLVEAQYQYRSHNFPAAFNAARHALILARSCPDLPLIGESLLMLSHLHSECGEQARAEACWAEVRALAASAFAPL